MSKSTHSDQRVTSSPILEILLAILAHVTVGLKLDNDFAAGEVDTPWASSSVKCQLKLMQF